MMSDKKVVWSRTSMVLIALGLMLGVSLIWIPMANCPKMERHVGTIVLADQDAYDAFARSAVSNDIWGYSIKGDEFPYVVLLDARTPAGSVFTYGETSNLSVFDSMLARDSITDALMLLVGIVLVVGVVFLLLLSGIWPKLTDHQPRFSVEWIPDKKPEPKGIETE